METKVAYPAQGTIKTSHLLNPSCKSVGTGKSSLITSLVKDIFVTSKIQPVLPAITIGAPDNVTTTIVDTTGVSSSAVILKSRFKEGV